MTEGGIAVGLNRSLNHFGAMTEGGIALGLNRSLNHFRS
jgi:hypothetical protein